MRKLYVYVSLSVLAFVAGCQSSGIELDDLLQYLADHREEIIDLANQIPTPAPTPTATPEPTCREGVTYHRPVYASTAQAIVDCPGFHLTTGHDLPWLPPRDKYSSVGCGTVTFTDVDTGQVVAVEPNTDQWLAVDGHDNWSKGYGYYWYGTRAVVNDGGTNPTADGTRRVVCMIPFELPGTWRVSVEYRATKNRTSSAYLGLTTRHQDGTLWTAWYTWNQKGDGVWHDGHVTIDVVDGFVFAEEEE